MSEARVPRIMLGKITEFGSRAKIYQTPDALEVDDFDHYQVTRRRVFYDDVVLVTYHRYRGVLFLVFTAIAGLCFAFPAVLVFMSGEWVGAIVLGILASLFWVPFVLRVVLQVDTITVFGQRSKVELRFFFRKGRARRVFQDLCGIISRRQDEVAAAAQTAAREAAAPLLTDALLPPPPPAPPAAEAPPPPAG